MIPNELLFECCTRLVTTGSSVAFSNLSFWWVQRAAHMHGIDLWTAASSTSAARPPARHVHARPSSTTPAPPLPNRTLCYRPSTSRGAFFPVDCTHELGRCVKYTVS